jgi:hypothetical protein
MSTWLGSSEDRFDGVCTNVEFPFPCRLVVGALVAGTGIDPDGDPRLAAERRCRCHGPNRRVAECSVARGKQDRSSQPDVSLPPDPTPMLVQLPACVPFALE